MAEGECSRVVARGSPVTSDPDLVLEWGSVGPPPDTGYNRIKLLALSRVWSQCNIYGNMQSNMGPGVLPDVAGRPDGPNDPRAPVQSLWGAELGVPSRSVGRPWVVSTIRPNAGPCREGGLELHPSPRPPTAGPGESRRECEQCVRLRGGMSLRSHRLFGSRLNGLRDIHTSSRDYLNASRPRLDLLDRFHVCRGSGYKLKELLSCAVYMGWRVRTPFRVPSIPFYDGTNAHGTKKIQCDD